MVKTELTVTITAKTKGDSFLLGMQKADSADYGLVTRSGGVYLHTKDNKYYDITTGAQVDMSSVEYDAEGSHSSYVSVIPLQI